MPQNGLVLSLCPGVGLLDRGFESVGYQVVRGPDPLWGGTIETCDPPADVFEGVIGGPPCQGFSRANRDPDPVEGVRLIAEFLRVIARARPEWFLMENVVGVPDVAVEGYTVQRLNLNARECGMDQNRPRCFQFGSLDGIGLVIVRSSPRDVASQSCCMASEGGRKGKRSWPAFCVAQGLPPTFDLPAFTLGGKYRAVGNGVPVPMARAVAIAVHRRRVTQAVRVCVCDCGRPVEGKQLAATAGCRKRMERRRDASRVTGPGPVTPAASR